MNIYKEYRYPKILSEVIKERKKINPKINFQHLSASARIPKSYLSRVIHGGANLNEDQMDLVCSYLGFDETESDYMQLLLAYERSSLKDRKDKLKKKIAKVRARQLNTDQHLDSPSPTSSLTAPEDYYLDPVIQIVHISLTIRKFQKDPSQLRTALNISSERLEEILSLLEKMRAITRTATEVKVLVDDIHLPADSRLYRAWRNQMKFLTIHHLNALPSDSSYSFSVVFSADEAARLAIQSAFLEYLHKIREIAESAPKKNTYHLSFELFPWMLSKS